MHFFGNRHEILQPDSEFLQYLIEPLLERFPFLINDVNGCSHNVLIWRVLLPFLPRNVLFTHPLDPLPLIRGETYG